MNVQYQVAGSHTLARCVRFLTGCPNWPQPQVGPIFLKSCYKILQKLPKFARFFLKSWSKAAR